MRLARSLGTLLSIKRSAACRTTSHSSPDKNLSRFQASDFTLGAKYRTVSVRSSFKFPQRRNHRVARDINLSQAISMADCTESGTLLSRVSTACQKDSKSNTWRVNR